MLNNIKEEEKFKKIYKNKTGQRRGWIPYDRDPWSLHKN